jgi:hypothetical protein
MKLLHVFGNMCTYSIKVVNKSLIYVAEFLYLELAVTNQNCIHGEIKSVLSLETAGYC